MNTVESVGAVVSNNQNCRFDGVKSPERSSAFTGKPWGTRNAEVGRETSNGMELDFLFGGVIRNYFNSFFDLEENPVLGFIVRLLTGGGDFLEGRRDQRMYGELYGHGVDLLENSSNEELKHEQGIVNKFDKQEDKYTDDLAQNEMQKGRFQERVVSTLGNWATKLSIYKPAAYLVSGVLGNSWKLGIQTLFDLPARAWWRCRMFGKSLHSNFVTTVWDLTRLKFMSFFNDDSAKDYANKTKELGKKSDEYFIGKDKNYKSNSNAGLGTYVSMLSDRMSEHWQNVWNPKAALEQKCNNGFLTRTTEKERKADKDKSKSFENGYVDPNSERDQKEQRRLALVDFTGPICAGLGLLGSAIFDPLKIIWSVAGIERGAGLINALSASRKMFSLINYIPRFMISEMNEGEKYKELEEQMRSGTSNKAVAERYYALKNRYHNALLGMAMAAGNICEPFLHLKRGVIGDSKLGNFLIDSVIKFNDTFFLRFFSKRREVQGRLEQLKVMAQEKLGKQHISNEDYASLSNTDFDELMKNRTTVQPDSERSVVDSVVGWACDKLSAVKKACSGESAYVEEQRQAA